MLPVEILLANRGPSLMAPQAVPDIFDQLSLVLCPAFANGVALDVLIQKFVRIQTPGVWPGELALRPAGKPAAISSSRLGIRQRVRQSRT